MISMGIGLCFLLIIPCLITHQPLWRTIIEVLGLLGVAIGMLLAWPDHLRIEMRGVSSHWLLGRRRLIEWKQVARARPEERRYFGLSFLRESNYLVEGLDGTRIRHTERHPDRERFVHELRRHEVDAEEAWAE